MITSFSGKGVPLAQADIDAALDVLGGDRDEASLWAVVAVETKGFGFLIDRRCQILLERHIFHKLTGGRYSAANPDISNPNTGGYLGGAAEYTRLEKAIGLDETAALRSASWGLGQIMGFNAAAAGFGTVEAMVTAMIAGEGAHVRAFAKFIQSNGPMLTAYRARNWARFAYFYNGSGYAENHYDTKLAQYREIYANAAERPDLDVRKAQACLIYLKFLPGSRNGEAHGVDGLLGPGTRAALGAYRQARGMGGAGYGPDVLARLVAEAGI